MRSWPALSLVGVLLMVPFVQAVSETFEDDTPGEDPSNGYTYTEESGAGASVSSAQAIEGTNSLSVPSDTWASFDYNGTFDACGGDLVQVWGRPSFGSSDTQSTDVMSVSFESPLASATDLRTGQTDYLGVVIDPDNSTHFTVRPTVKAQGTGGTGGFSPITNLPFGEWYRFRITAADCFSSSPSVSVQVWDDGGNSLGTASRECDGCGAMTAGVYDTYSVGVHLDGAGSPPSLFVDAFVAGAELVAQPSAPAGLFASVLEPKTTTNGSEEGTILLQWPVSSDDPDQDQGAYEYQIFLDGLNIGADDTTAADGEGFRFHEVEIGGTVVGEPTEFKVRATNTTTGAVSVFSCAVTVDTSEEGSTDECGEAGAPQNPLPPTGLSGVVTDAKATTNGSESGKIELRWPVSPDDPDQDQGAYEYQIFLDGLNIGADDTTAADGEGFRFHEVEIGGTQLGSLTSFQIRARNVTSGLQSSFSCTITVDTGVQGSSDTCGTGAPGFGGIDHTTETDTAAGLSGFCSDLMGDSPASLFLCGLILVVIVFLGVGAAFAALAGAPGLPAVIAGGLAAFGMMVFLINAQLWSLGAAAIIILMSTGVALGLLRGLFFGGGSRGG